MTEQPVAKGTREDVLPIVRRDFPPTEVDAAFALLAAHESSSNEKPARVPLAALKCAQGDLAKLKWELEAARLDYRNVLLRAEYPIDARVAMRTKRGEAEYDESDLLVAKRSCDLFEPYSSDDA
jgi:hypothetical protein